ncbi:ABC transporter permease [Paenibacillus segetis]|uniref:ABC transporter permease n=1 Tax=Paenibacillus segetis TaxID=1325360 RepID=A0ABQ1YVN2_9BACL|nr:ABC transporter permease [Paenibacillus segetis]GGH37810.1 ABC transporter permease [Paenibacillus segetis]
MKKKALWTDISREIWRTKARFLSIFAIIALGVGFFSGIKATGPDMLDTADYYYKQHKLMDLKVVSNYGLTESNIALIKQTPGVNVVQPGYSADVFLGDTSLIAKVFSYKSDDTLNGYRIISGRLPEHSGEIAIDGNQRMARAFGLGDTITFTNPDPEVDLSDTFNVSSYKVVGIVNSPQYVESIGRGTSRIGKGTTDVFAIIPEGDFNLSIFTEAYIGLEGVTDKTAYTSEYDDLVEKQKIALEQAFSAEPEERLAEVRAEGQKKLDEARDKIDDAKKQLTEAEQKLGDAKVKLDEGWKSYNEGVAKLNSEIAKGQAKLDQAAKDIAAGTAELDKNRKSLNEGQNQLKAGQAALDAKKESIQPQIEQGRKLVQSLNQVISLSPDSIPTEQKQQLIAGAEAADPQLGGAVAGFMNGSVDVNTLKNALSTFDQGLTQGEKQLQDAQAEINAKQKVINEGKNKLAAAERKLAQGEVEYTAGLTKLDQSKQEGIESLAKAKKELDQGQADYDQGMSDYKAEKQKADIDIAKAEDDIAKGQKELNELEVPKYYVLDRSSNTGYNEYSDNAERLASIATAFPVFFFLIAALVSLTTMTRMVEEHRLQIGTFKALGYGNLDIMKKFLVYGTLASLVASIAGLIVGFTVFPNIIFNAYGTIYNLPKVRISYYASYSILSIVVALICTTMTAIIATRVELRSNASVLMRPRAPKSGQRIMLERIPFIWKRLGFIGKVTARNLFRYKQRMFMTVIGVAGCTALILTGFGLKDSIGDIAPLQYGQIMKYNALVAFNDDKDESGRLKQDYDNLIAEIPEITGTLNVAMDSMTTIAKGVNNQDVTLFIPEAASQLNEFVSLQDRKSGEREQLSQQGAIVTEKLAKLYGLEPGSILTVRNTDNELFKLKVTGITENYSMHYIYMLPEYYEEIFGKVPNYNAQLINYSDTSQTWENAFGEKLTNNERVGIVSFSSGVGDAFKDTMKSMDVVMLVLIISAAALAFVVLYNLTNINVSERIRELSTIKVLGFYDKEVTMYIYRENIILSFLGIIGGSFLGILLHRFVLHTAELDIMMFSPNINWLSFGYAAVLTLLFSGIVMVTMHYKLKHIDMIEALKSVE